MKIVVCSDLHPDKSTAGLPRFDDVERALEEVLEEACRKGDKADLFVFAGDLCDPDAPELIRCVCMVMRAAETLRSCGVPSLWLAGNHDVVEDGRGTTVLDPLKFVLAGSGVAVVTEPRIDTFGGCPVACYPYTASSHSYDPEEVTRKFGSDQRFDPVFGVKLVVSHLMLEGIGPGSETTDMPRGRDVFLPVELVRESFPNAVIVNAHYHRGRTWRPACWKGPGGVEVVGSLVNFTRADVGNRPRFLVLEV